MNIFSVYFPFQFLIEGNAQVCEFTDKEIVASYEARRRIKLRAIKEVRVKMRKEENCDEKKKKKRKEPEEGDKKKDAQM